MLNQKFVCWFDLDGRGTLAERRATTMADAAAQFAAFRNRTGIVCVEFWDEPHEMTRFDVTTRLEYEAKAIP